MAVSSSVATKLYVASYGGEITSLSLTEQDQSFHSVHKIASTDACASSPSWLTLDKSRGILYCVGEGLASPAGSLTSFKTHSNGSLSKIAEADTILGGVSAVRYGGGGSFPALAIAHYAGSALSTWSLAGNGTFKPLQKFGFTLPHPGPVPDRQSASHPHQASVDPTGRYIVVPDLGGDLIRVFQIDAATNALLERDPLKVKPGSGPRHAVFWSPTGEDTYDRTHSQKPIMAVGRHIYLYVITELANTVIGYSVTYLSSGGLQFSELFVDTTYGGPSAPIAAAAAEIAIASHDRLLISNRNDSTFTLPHNQGVSDSLASFSMNDDGTLDFMTLSPAGGRFPRHFSVNKAGNLVAVGLQLSHRVVIFRRHIKTGRMDDPVAEIDIDGQITCVIWNE
ncbi:MAG: hypothetical protein M1830_008086 [Pleopsidium flavum]|nr:MAG: hypothetical protein M1830_008086 [Pleopsidium flavum]